MLLYPRRLRHAEEDARHIDRFNISGGDGAVETESADQQKREVVDDELGNPDLQARASP